MTRNHYKSLGRTKIKSGFLEDFPLRLQHWISCIWVYWCAVWYCPIYPLFSTTSNMIPVYCRKEQVYIHRNTYVIAKYYTDLKPTVYSSERPWHVMMYWNSIHKLRTITISHTTNNNNKRFCNESVLYMMLMVLESSKWEIVA